MMIAASARLIAFTASSRWRWISSAWSRVISPPMRLLRINILVLVAQHVLLHLAHGVARQLAHHEHALGHLELGEPAVEALEHAGLADIGARTTHHDSGDTLAEIGMRHADHGRFHHARHGVDLALDLLRIDVEAARDHQVLAASEDVDIALVVD